MTQKVLLGMSGGVDSSVSAILLKQKGYDVVGITMKLWKSDDEEIEGGCCSFSSSSDAKRVCDFLKIPHYTINYKKQFKEKVIDNFINEYANQRTPNPCIECNRHLKFDCMYKTARELEIDYIATGHYAITEYSEKYKRVVLKKSKNIKKDQSYVLYCIPKEILDKVIFPLGEFENKEYVRSIARKNNCLMVANKPDSEDICFIPNGNYKEFLERNSSIKQKEGNIVNFNGDILGKHNGLYNYTIGQRRGLRISNKVPLFVTGFNKEKNEVIVGEEKELYKTEMYVNEINLLLFDELKEKLEVSIKTRYSAKEEKATIEMIDKDLIKVIFENPVARITAGQSAVFYIDDIVVGGGKIINC